MKASHCAHDRSIKLHFMAVLATDHWVMSVLGRNMNKHLYYILYSEVIIDNVSRPR